MGELVLDNVCFAYEDDNIPKHLRKRHREQGFTDDELVLKHLNLIVRDGEFLCLVGHSGCGKTTLLQNLAGLLRPVAGTIAIDNKPLNRPGLDRAVVFQNYALFPWLTALKNVEFGVRQASVELGRNLSKQQIRDISQEYLVKVNMEKAQDLHPYQLSGGMQQRVAIARALAMDAEILLFDEPFGALDVKTRRELQAIMENLWIREEIRKTAVFITHDIDEAIFLADRIIFMTNGVFHQSFEVGAERPRDPETYPGSPEYKRIKADLLELFYNAKEASHEPMECEQVWESGVGR
ncbi:ABC transporter ATP-binding protein [Desulfitobacterium chlororespirans]|uniref:NitT/TauT family transport system ATP-binding protein n=1 Tax=Desulfitobacterium chlororespirans DSM 11544 TaxID=1121395 RepID=A0A1M7SHI7_9FIRM|nr:ABC transporter ATP-binding protein [Desulfitobacterium chlororespirans]SHN57956.1 NitT/TauT family transport system ATP-binding protein [Desulfitobacterium chlororespirans DSM 11544]